MFQRKKSPIVVSVYLVVRGPVVWIPRIPLWKGLLLRGTPIRIPNHRAPNQQFTISWKNWQARLGNLAILRWSRFEEAIEDKPTGRLRKRKERKATETNHLTILSFDIKNMISKKCNTKVGF